MKRGKSQAKKPAADRAARRTRVKPPKQAKMAHRPKPA
jgi:hypothetical protein